MAWGPREPFGFEGVDRAIGEIASRSATRARSPSPLTTTDAMFTARTSGAMSRFSGGRSSRGPALARRSTPRAPRTVRRCRAGRLRPEPPRGCRCHRGEWDPEPPSTNRTARPDRPSRTRRWSTSSPGPPPPRRTADYPARPSGARSDRRSRCSSAPRCLPRLRKRRGTSVRTRPLRARRAFASAFHVVRPFRVSWVPPCWRARERARGPVARRRPALA